MTPLDIFLDRLSSTGWSYDITTYVDEETQWWARVEARQRGRPGPERQPVLAICIAESILPLAKQSSGWRGYAHTTNFLVSGHRTHNECRDDGGGEETEDRGHRE